MMRSVVFLRWAVCVVLLTLPLRAQEGPPLPGDAGTAVTEVAGPEAAAVVVSEDDTVATEAPASPPVDEEDEDKEPAVVVKRDVRVRRQRKPEFDLRESIFAEAFEFDMAGRRDPFSYFAERADPIDAGGQQPIELVVPEEPETTPIEEQELIVTSAADLLAMMKKNIDAGNYKEAVQTYDKKLTALFKRRDELTTEPLKERLATIESEAGKVGDLINQAKLDILYDDLAAHAKRVEQSWQAARYDQVIATAKEFERIFTESSSVMLGTGDPKKKQAVNRMRTKVNLKKHRSEVRQEFAKKTFEITGIAWSPGQSLAIINEQDVAEGESIEDVRIAKIRPGRITMEYRGESFEKFVE